MKWYWKVRLTNVAGSYYTTQICTEQSLNEIGTIKDFYFTLTGCKMLIEGMSNEPYNNLSEITNAFKKVHGLIP